MAKIALSENTYSIIPEGTHIFQITAVNFKEDFGKMEITMKTATGLTHTERYSFVKSNGERNNVVVSIFSYFARVALQDYERKSIDHTEIVGRFIKCEVTHQEVPNKNDSNKMITFTRLGNKYEANGFDDDGEVAPAKPTTNTTVASAPKQKVDLSKILGKK